MAGLADHQFKSHRAEPGFAQSARQNWGWFPSVSTLHSDLNPLSMKIKFALLSLVVCFVLKSVAAETMPRGRKIERGYR